MRNIHLTFVYSTYRQKSKVEIFQNFVAFSEYMNFILLANSMKKVNLRYQTLAAFHAFRFSLTN